MRSLTEKEQYLQSHVSHIPKGLEKIEARLKETGKWGINVSASEGAFLRFLVELFKPQNVVGLGTQLGYSTLWMMDHSIRPFHLRTFEKDESHFMEANRFFLENSQALRTRQKNLRSYEWGGSQILSSYWGEALDLLGEVEPEGPFDMVFIDANKGGYPDYLSWCEKNVRPGGLIVADNTFLFGSVWRKDPEDLAPKNPWKKMRSFNEKLSQASKFKSFILPTPEGMSLAIVL